MSQIIQAKSPVVGVVTDFKRYVDARKEVDELIEKINKQNRQIMGTNHPSLRVADMPMTIHAITTNLDIRGAIRPNYVDTITGEYHGQRDGNRSYEVWHSAGSLATVDGLTLAFPNMERYGFMKIGDTEWQSIGDGSFQGNDVVRVHLADLRRGVVPSVGTSYTVFALLDVDKPKINPSDQLGYDAFMKDDRVLMVAGSPDNREALAKMFFGAKRDGGEGWSTVGSYHRIKDVGFDSPARGRLVYLNSHNGGLIGNLNIHNYGRFFGVSDGVASVVSAAGATLENGVSKDIVIADLEQIAAVVESLDSNREDIRRLLQEKEDQYKR